MRLKLFRADSMAEAMSQVRATLGADALILASRRVGGGVEITAALDPDAQAPAAVTPAAAPATPPAVQADAAVRAALEYHGVPADLRANLLDGALEQTLARDLRFARLHLDPGAPPLLLAGPPGAGKTLTLARLATRLVIGGALPMVITTDGQRAGACEQLAAFTTLLGLELIIAAHPVALARALARRTHATPVLIDTPGLDPSDPAQHEELAGLAATAGATVALALPAGMDTAEAADLAADYANAGASLLIATRLDVCRRLGGILAAAAAGPLALSEAGIGPGAADGLTPLTPAVLATRLLQTHPGPRHGEPRA